jgi:hypothetical protein
MNISKLIIILILNIVIPVISVISTTANVLAKTEGKGNIFHDGRGSFSGGKWSIYQECGEEGVFLRSGTSKAIKLFNERTETKNNGKKIYIWVQKGAQYKLSWNPKDSSFARLEIINTSGIKIVNTLLKAGLLPPC